MTDTCKTDARGTKRYYRDGKLHRDGDLPAIEYTDGDKSYWRNGEQYFPEVKK